jgi:hypothetical protein
MHLPSRPRRCICVRFPAPHPLSAPVLTQNHARREQRPIPGRVKLITKLAKAPEHELHEADAPSQPAMTLHMRAVPRAPHAFCTSPYSKSRPPWAKTNTQTRQTNHQAGQSPRARAARSRCTFPAGHDAAYACGSPRPTRIPAPVLTQNHARREQRPIPRRVKLNPKLAKAPEHELHETDAPSHPGPDPAYAVRFPPPPPPVRTIP